MTSELEDKPSSTEPNHEFTPDDRHWHDFLTTGNLALEKRARRLFSHLPHDPRCKLCNVPFEGIGAPVARLFFGKRQSNVDPRFCNACTDFVREHPGGAEVEVTMVFADIRGSTAIAEKLSPAEYGNVINRFYTTTTNILLKSGALIDRLVGDEIVAMYVPGLSGPAHAQQAIDAAQEMLRATGHADSSGPWIPVGVGVHTGLTYVGTVGSKGGTVDFTALGDVPNVGARLASLAASGEVLVSDAATLAANLDTTELEKRRLELKGRVESVETSVIRIAAV